MARRKKEKVKNLFEPGGDSLGVWGDSSVDQSEWQYEVKSIGEMPSSHPPARWLIILTYSLIAVAGLVFLVRLSNLQVAKGYEYRLQAEGNRVRSHLVAAPRGEVVDRHGTKLATNTANYVLEIYPYSLPIKTEELSELVTRIKNVTGFEDDLLDEISKAKRRGFDPVIVRSDIDRDQALRWQMELSDLPGVSISASPKRQYTDLPSLGHLVGYVGKMSEDDIDRYPQYPISSLIGKSGIELVYDADLRGQPGENQVEIDSAGHLRRLFKSTLPQVGSTVKLGLDAELQTVMANTLRAAMEQSGSPSGVAVALDPRDGAVLGMVSLPDYNPMVFSGRVSDEEYSQIINNPGKPLLNRAIAGLFPPGSSVKPFVASGALDAGIVNEKTVLTTPPEIKVGEWTFPDWKPHGSADVKKAIAESNNVFFYMIGGGYNKIGGLGVDRMKNYLNLFGLGEETGIDLTGEREGLVPDPAWKEAYKQEKWYIGDTYHLAIGQGDLLTSPLAMTAATAAIANGGTLFEPRVATAVVSADTGVVEKELASSVKRTGFINGEALRIVRDGMRQVVTSGSAHSIFGDKFPLAVAGKTGTAQFGSEGKTHAWFTSFAPFDDPKIALTIFLEGGGEGFAVAAPVAKTIYEWYISHIDSW